MVQAVAYPVQARRVGERPDLLEVVALAPVRYHGAPRFDGARYPMPNRTSSTTGSELFIVDNSDEDWKVLRYLQDWCQIAKGLDAATDYFEIGSLLALKEEWQKVDRIRILMGDECSMRTKGAFEAGLAKITKRLNESIEEAKEQNDFLVGVPAIVDAIRSGKIQCRVYRKNKFQVKAYITHGRLPASQGTLWS
jgi:hypothetical protein